MPADVTPGAKLTDGLNHDWIVTRVDRELVSITKVARTRVVAKITRNMARAWADRAATVNESLTVRQGAPHVG